MHDKLFALMDHARIVSWTAYSQMNVHLTNHTSAQVSQVYVQGQESNVHSHLSKAAVELCHYAPMDYAALIVKAAKITTNKLVQILKWLYRELHVVPRVWCNVQMVSAELIILTAQIPYIVQYL
jgi:hypothetical protein